MMAERSATEELDALLDDAREAYDEDRIGRSLGAIRAGAKRRVRALEPGLPRFDRKLNRGLFGPLTAPLVGLYRALTEDAGLEREVALAQVEALLQAAYRRRLSPPLKGKLMGRALRLPIVRSAIMRAAERAREDPEGFVMRRVDSPGDLLAFDVERCPIATYLAAQGVPELGPLICEVDNLLAETLPGISLRRTGTIARGAQRCDFRYRRDES